jgi:hypothetical protein
MSLLRDPAGQLSTMRVMSFIALFMALALTITNLVQGKPIPVDVLIVWITAAFAPKAIQRYAEGRGESGKQTPMEDAGAGDNPGTPPGNGTTGDGGLGK